MICEHMLHLWGLNINSNSLLWQLVTNDSMQSASLICLNSFHFSFTIELGHYYIIHFHWREGGSFTLSKMTDWTINIALSRVKIDYYNLLHPTIYKEMPPLYLNDCSNEEKNQRIFTAKSVADGLGLDF